ncbi:MAG TPA: ABC transporter ATP-binding protein [Solirubrobacteraceae bacterium]|nr:ABC transporter ATP-binding protein [Solirubrobacteraceae bacterium]
MLEVQDLVCEYGAIRALDGVSLQAAAGSVTAVLGANGAGKTTLLRAISGLKRPRAGRVALDGREITAAGVEEIVRLGLLHVPEGRGVIAELTVAENLRLGALARGARRGDGIEAIYELFPPLRARRSEPAASLSGGERQMLSIGRALMAAPKALLLDEPSLGLAPLIVAQIMGLVRELCEERRIAVLLVEQNARSALSIADHALVLDLGHVVASETPEQLAREHELLHAYLGY